MDNNFSLKNKGLRLLVSLATVEVLLHTAFYILSSRFVGDGMKILIDGFIYIILFCLILSKKDWARTVLSILLILNAAFNFFSLVDFLGGPFLMVLPKFLAALIHAYVAYKLLTSESIIRLMSKNHTENL